MLFCTKCHTIHERVCSKCKKPGIPYTGGHGYRRKDKSYSWKFFINGNQRSKGTDRFETLKEAVADFIEIFSYSACGEKDE